MNVLMLPDFRVRQRDFLLEISRAITAQLDLSEVLRRVLHASVVMLAGQSGLIALRASDDRFYVRAISGVSAELIPDLNAQLHQLTSILQEGQDTEVFNQQLRDMMMLIDDKLRQSVALPLTFADEPLGLMIVFRAFRSGATENDLQILQSFADQAAIAVHNAQLYENINQERQRLAAIVDYSADGVMILSADLRILRFNRALERITAWSAADALGLYQAEVIQWQRLESDDLHIALEDGWPLVSRAEKPLHIPLYVEGDLIRRDGLTVSIGITYAPLMTPDNRLVNIIANVRDITNFRKAQEMQSTFISVISHELKTPVAIIKGYAATLRRPDVEWDPEVLKENLGVIEDEADRLTALIQNLLTASKLQVQRQVSLDVGEVWLDELVRLSAERFKLGSDRHQVVVDLPDNLPVIQGDETKLRQVIDNLLSNAIKYSPQGGRVEIGVTYDDRWLRLVVRDPGIGLSEEEQERVFDRFYRVENQLSRKTQGAGLGLYLSKAIIEAHGGIIGVESSPGNGSTFYFMLPRR